MKFILSAALCFYLQFSFAQKLDITSLEKILDAPISSIDSILKRSKFSLTEKEIDKRYRNYYYTSYDKEDLHRQLFRSLSYMDIYDDNDTSRIILYRTYYETDQEELKKQLLAKGYVLKNQDTNNFVYKKGDLTITNKISQKTPSKGKTMTAYEFELGR
jgi:hypothetical protein